MVDYMKGRGMALRLGKGRSLSNQHLPRELPNSRHFAAGISVVHVLKALPAPGIAARAMADVTREIKTPLCAYRIIHEFTAVVAIIVIFFKSLQLYRRSFLIIIPSLLMVV